MLPNKTFRTSTPDSVERQPEKEPIRCPLKEIVTHRPVLEIPPVNIVAAPGAQARQCTNRLTESKQDGRPRKKC